MAEARAGVAVAQQEGARAGVAVAQQEGARAGVVAAARVLQLEEARARVAVAARYHVCTRQERWQVMAIYAGHRLPVSQA